MYFSTAGAFLQDFNDDFNLLKNFYISGNLHTQKFNIIRHAHQRLRHLLLSRHRNLTVGRQLITGFLHPAQIFGNRRLNRRIGRFQQLAAVAINFQTGIAAGKSGFNNGKIILARKTAI